MNCWHSQMWVQEDIICHAQHSLLQQSCSEIKILTVIHHANTHGESNGRALVMTQLAAGVLLGTGMPNCHQCVESFGWKEKQCGDS